MASKILPHSCRFGGPHGYRHNRLMIGTTALERETKGLVDKNYGSSN